jgi:hypothetical protein
MIGFSFADELEAAQFLDRVQNKERFLLGVVASKPAVSPTTTVPESPRPSSVTSTPPPQPIPPPQTTAPAIISIDRKDPKKDSSGGFFGFGARKETTIKKGKLDKSMIGAPTDFQHVSHVGYSAQSGFSVQNIPMEWKIIFQKAGITDEQLQDKKQKKVVKQFMKDNAHLLGGVSSPALAQPAPGSSQPKRAPPPPPPSRGLFNLN